MSGLQNCLFSLQVLPKTLKRMKFMILKMCQSTTIKEIFTECYLYNLFAFYVASILSLSLFEESSTFMTPFHFWPYSWQFLTRFVAPVFVALEVSPGSLQRKGADFQIRCAPPYTPVRSKHQGTVFRWGYAEFCQEKNCIFHCVIQN